MSPVNRSAVVIDDALLRAWPLPQHAHDADKEARGNVLVIAGSDEMPGAAVLSATAALRAGAGKLAVACVPNATTAVAVALQEACVVQLPATTGSTIADLPREVPAALQAALRAADAVLIGPGMQPEDVVVAVVRMLLPQLSPETRLVLDAAAMAVVCTGDDDANGRAAPPWPRETVLTPHAGEMARLFGISKAEVLRDPADIAARAARRWGAVVALKGATTHIATSDGRCWVHAPPDGAGAPGLGTSGSGDVLAGIVAGLAARGAPIEQAACWGVALHARAGRALADRIGPLGFLARELAAEVPAAMAALSRASDRAG